MKRFHSWQTKSFCKPFGIDSFLIQTDADDLSMSLYDIFYIHLLYFVGMICNLKNGFYCQLIPRSFLIVDTIRGFFFGYVYVFN